MQIILYCITNSYITIINMHTQALYWSCIELIKDVHLNREGKVQNALWTITCTHSINYNCFNFSKVLIKIYNTDISIATVYLYCFWTLRVLLPTLYTLARHVLVVSLYSQLFPFLDRITNRIFNCTCSLGHNHIILRALHHFIYSNLHHVIFVMHL